MDYRFSLFSIYYTEEKFGHLLGKIFVVKDKNSIMPFLCKLDKFSKPGEDINGSLYLRYYNASSRGPGNLEILNIPSQNIFWRSRDLMLNLQSPVTWTILALIFRGCGGNWWCAKSKIKRRSPKLAVPTRVMCTQYRKTLHLLHKHSFFWLTCRRRSGDVVLVSKAKLIEKLANDIEPTTVR